MLNAKIFSFDSLYVVKNSYLVDYLDKKARKSTRDNVIFRIFFVFLQKIYLSKREMNLGLTEIVLIALVVLLLFGGKKIPELMKGLGKGVKSFKDGIKGIDDDLDETSGTGDKNKG